MDLVEKTPRQASLRYGKPLGDGRSAKAKAKKGRQKSFMTRVKTGGTSPAPPNKKIVGSSGRQKICIEVRGTTRGRKGGSIRSKSSTRTGFKKMSRSFVA